MATSPYGSIVRARDCVRSSSVVPRCARRVLVSHAGAIVRADPQLRTARADHVDEGSPALVRVPRAAADPEAGRTRWTAVRRLSTWSGRPLDRSCTTPPSASGQPGRCLPPIAAARGCLARRSCWLSRLRSFFGPRLGLAVRSTRSDFVSPRGPSVVVAPSSPGSGCNPVEGVRPGRCIRPGAVPRAC